MVPTERPESDGTLEWDATTIVVVHTHYAGATGVGYTYGDRAIRMLVESKLAPVLEGRDPLDVRGAWGAMQRAVRNDGPFGLAQYAIAAVDIALWDLKARLDDVPLTRLLGAVRETIPAYASGGFTSLSTDELCEQLAGWVAAGFGTVKMKVGRDPHADPDRVARARAAIGSDPRLFVDANGAYDAARALELGERFAEHGVSWYEEPVSSDDLDGLRMIRERLPAGIDVAAGEYGTDVPYFERMLGVVDTLQADVTRCGGVTGMLHVGALCKAAGKPLSAHCAPQASAHVCCALESAVHLEYFHDHARIEHMLFDGALEPAAGELRPDQSRPGLGIELKRSDAERWAA
jgi:L-alanine-DL-glutamate epimerase-like enolase superfamily enzyme